jgi:hypothetical protein
MALSGYRKPITACVKHEAGGEVEQSRKCYTRFDAFKHSDLLYEADARGGCKRKGALDDDE